MTTDYTSPVGQDKAQTPPPPMSRSGMLAAIAAFIQFSQTTNAAIVDFDNMLMGFSSSLTQIGNAMDAQLASDTEALSKLSGSSNSAAIAAANETYQNDQIKFQNEMTPFNTQTDSWTDGVKQLSSDVSNFFQYCTSIVSMLTNLSNRL